MRPIRDSPSRLEGGWRRVAPLPIGNNRVGARQVVVVRQGYVPGNTVDATGPDPINGIARCASNLTICQLCPLATQTYRRPLTRLSVRSAVSSWCCAGACSARRACTKAGPYEVSRSRMRCRGAWSHGNASVTWREIHSAVGFAVTPNDTQSRRPWRTMTRQYRIWNAIVGRTKRSIAAMPST
jgi:hypothetical protein